MSPLGVSPSGVSPLWRAKKKGEKGNLQSVTITPGGPRLPWLPASPLLPGSPWKIRLPEPAAWPKGGSRGGCAPYSPCAQAALACPCPRGLLARPVGPGGEAQGGAGRVPSPLPRPRALTCTPGNPGSPRTPLGGAAPVSTAPSWQPRGHGSSSVPPPSRYLRSLSPRGASPVAPDLALGGEKNPQTIFFFFFLQDFHKYLCSQSLRVSPRGCGCLVPTGQPCPQGAPCPALPGHLWVPEVPRSPSCPWLLPGPGRDIGAAGWGHRGGCDVPHHPTAHLVPFGAGWSCSSHRTLSSGRTLGERQKRLKVGTQRDPQRDPHHGEGVST